MNEYHKQAEDFLSRNKVNFEYQNLGKSYHWNMYRYSYLITMTRTTKTGEVKTLEINFWGSNHDFTHGIKEIHAYDVLACLSGEWQYKTVGDIISEFGNDTTGIDVSGLLEEGRKLRKFFTPRMLEELSEIQ